MAPQDQRRKRYFEVPYSIVDEIGCESMNREDASLLLRLTRRLFGHKFDAVSTERCAAGVAVVVSFDGPFPAAGLRSLATVQSGCIVDYYFNLFVYCLTDPEVFVPPTPVDELFEDGVCCVKCEKHLPHEAFFDGVDAYYCEECMGRLIQDESKEARRYAEENCKIIKPLPKYNSRYEYRCTPEEYEMGERESYTQHSHMCHCRHECTNYDKLIRPLSRDIVTDQICYNAIHRRITELLLEAINDAAYDEDEDEDDEDIELCE